MATRKAQRTQTLEFNGKRYAITGHAADGLPIIRGNASTSQEGFDDEGNPTLSVCIDVPAYELGLAPGEMG